MQFKPRENSYHDHSLVLQDVLHGRVASLLRFLSSEQRMAGEGEALWDHLILYRNELDWLFTREDLRPLILNRRSAGQHYSILQSYFVFAQKLGPADSNGYYLREGEILWGRFFGDLGLLGADMKDPLYINLKNYLDWARYQPELNSSRMIAKIFWPYYLKLKSLICIPPSFLREALKIAIALNPVHAAARLERTDGLLRLNHRHQAIDELRTTLKIDTHHPVLESQLQKRYFELLAEHDVGQLLTDASRLFGCGGVSLHSTYWMDLALKLLEAGDPIGALFHHLKGFSYDTSARQRVAELRRILLILGEWDRAKEAETLMQNDSIESVVKIPEQLQSFIQIRNLNSNRFELVRDPFVFLGSETENGLEVRYAGMQHQGTILFCRARAWMQLEYHEDRFLLEEIDEPTPTGSVRRLEYAGFELELKPECLNRLTPFHFTRRKETSHD